MHKFSLVIYFDKKLTNKIISLQRELYRLTGSHACLDIWQPHLTIGSGIIVQDENIKQVKKILKSITSKVSPFEVVVKDFSFMNNWPGGKLPGHTKYLVGLDVKVNKNLSWLAQVVKLELTDKCKVWYEQPWPYLPHLTIAYKDLNLEGFKKANEIYKKKNFSGKTLINHIALVQKNKNGIWKKYVIFKFKK